MSLRHPKRQYRVEETAGLNPPPLIADQDKGKSLSSDIIVRILLNSCFPNFQVQEIESTEGNR